MTRRVPQPARQSTAKHKGTQQTKDNQQDNARDMNEISKDGDTILAMQRKTSNNEDTPIANEKANDQQSLRNDTEIATKTR